MAVYEEFHLRNIGTIPAPVTYSAVAQGDLDLGDLDLGADLTYRLSAVDAGGCDAGTLAAGTAIAEGEEFILAVDATQPLCIEVQLADSYGATLAEQGRVVWTFDAVQQE